MQSGGTKSLQSSCGTEVFLLQMPSCVHHSINGVRQRERVTVTIISIKKWPASQDHRPPNLQPSCLPPYHPSHHPGPCQPPPIKIRWLSGASWKVAITNPIYDSQRDKAKRWKSLNKWKIVLSFNFIHQQDHLSFKKEARLDSNVQWNGKGEKLQARGAGRESHLSFKV